MGRKSQIWSMDGMVATVIFVAAISAFIIIISLNLTSDKLQALKQESKVFPKLIENPENEQFAIVQQNRLNLTVVKAMQDEQYTVLRSSLGVKSDFCIYLEDEDGYLINMSSISGSVSKGAGLGSSEVNLTEDGVRCSKP